MIDILQYMPEMLTGDALDAQLRVLPAYDASIRTKPSVQRLIALQDIYSVFLPGVMSREIYSKLYLALLRSLRRKQSILAVQQYSQNSKIIRQQSYESILGGSDSFTIIGPSGIGKSSSVSRAINVLTETPILSLPDRNIIACLQVQAPADSSVKGLLLEILRKVDEILQTNYHTNAIRSHSTTDMLIGTVSQVSLIHIGLLIIDEIQNVVNQKNGKTVVGTLTQLINNSGVSICMVGTPDSNLFFSSSMMFARRSVGLTYTTLDYGDEFRNFCTAMLQYVYVQQPVRIDEGMLLWLYQHSSGNASVVVGILHDAQEIAILEGTEKLDIAALNTAYTRRMTMLHDHISPMPIKKAPLRKSARDILPSFEGQAIGDCVSIYDIIVDAKETQKNIITALRSNDIAVLEVVI